jgi:hypothetical protein
VLGTYTFDGADPAGDLTTPHDNGTAAPDMTYSILTRTGLLQNANSGVFRSRQYSTATTINTTQYVEFTLTADPGFALELHSLALQWQRTDGSPSTNRGPLNGAVRSSFEDYLAGSGTGSTWATTISGFTVVQANWDFTDYTTEPGGSVTFRIYGWNAGSTSLSNAAAGVALDNITPSGEVIALARMEASVAAPAAVIVGDAGEVQVSVQNTAAGGTAQEALSYAVTGTGDVTGSGGSGSLAPGPAEVVTLTIDTSQAGQRAGGVSVSSDNAWSTNGVAGQGSFEQGVAIDVLDHALASLSGEGALSEITLDFGTVQAGSTAELALAIHNLESTAGFTAGLDLDEVTETDEAGVFSSDLGAFANLAAGQSAGFVVALDTSEAGSFAGSYVLGLSDEDLPGAAGGQVLVVNLMGTVTAVPEPAGAAVVGIVALLMLRRRGRMR